MYGEICHFPEIKSEEKPILFTFTVSTFNVNVSPDLVTLI